MYATREMHGDRLQPQDGRRSSMEAAKRRAERRPGIVFKSLAGIILERGFFFPASRSVVICAFSSAAGAGDFDDGEFWRASLTRRAAVRSVATGASRNLLPTEPQQLADQDANQRRGVMSQ